MNCKQKIIRCLLLICLCAFALSVRAEILDRILAVVGGRIVTLSDSHQEHAIRLALGEALPKDDKAMLQDLIDARLLENEVDQFPGIDVSEQDIDARLQKIPNLQGLPTSVVRDAIRHRLYRAEFIELRFRQFIRPTDNDVRAYYDSVFVPEARNRGLNPVPAFDQVQELVRQNVIEEQLTHDVDNWLDTVRRRSEIAVFD